MHQDSARASGPSSSRRGWHLTLCRWMPTPQRGVPRSFSVSSAAMPAQFSAATSDNRPPSPSMPSITTSPGLSGSARAVTVSPSPCEQPSATTTVSTEARRQRTASQAWQPAKRVPASDLDGTPHPVEPGAQVGHGGRCKSHGLPEHRLLAGMGSGCCTATQGRFMYPSIPVAWHKGGARYAACRQVAQAAPGRQLHCPHIWL